MKTTKQITKAFQDDLNNTFNQLDNVSGYFIFAMTSDDILVFNYDCQELSRLSGLVDTLVLEMKIKTLAAITDGLETIQSDQLSNRYAESLELRENQAQNEDQDDSDEYDFSFELNDEMLDDPSFDDFVNSLESSKVDLEEDFKESRVTHKVSKKLQ